MQKETQEDWLTNEILKILAYQAVITSQGDNYAGEKDWALNKIKELIDKKLEEQKREILQSEIERKKKLLEMTIKYPLIGAIQSLADAQDKGYQQSVKDDITHLENLIKEIN